MATDATFYLAQQALTAVTNPAEAPPTGPVPPLLTGTYIFAAPSSLTGTQTISIPVPVPDARPGDAVAIGATGFAANEWFGFSVSKVLVGEVYVAVRPVLSSGGTIPAGAEIRVVAIRVD